MSEFPSATLENLTIIKQTLCLRNRISYRYSVSRTKRSLFYLMMAFLIVGFIIAECILPSERSQSVSDNNITYEGSFTWEKSDGEREAIEVPGRYDVKPGDTMVITTSA